MNRIFQARRWCCGLACCACLGLVSMVLLAADPPAQSASMAKGAEFDRTYAVWKALVLELHDLQLKYLTASEATKEDLRREYDEKLAHGEELVRQLTDSALVMSRDETIRRPNLDKFMLFSAAVAAIQDDYEKAQELLEPLEQREPLDPDIYELAGRVAFALADADRTEKFLQLAAKQLATKKAKLPEPSQRDLDGAETVRKSWLREQKFRLADAQADDLPRVLMQTTKGDMTIELFEDQAPNTVANFVRLVEDKFYDNTYFFRVESAFVAQGGDPLNNGNGGPGYRIACECDREDHRDHFRGSLSMAHAGKDTGGSQFFLSFRPSLHLNGQHTVFGRVIEGMDVLAKLQRVTADTREGVEPDKITSAKVLRKRDHVYKPERL